MTDFWKHGIGFGIMFQEYLTLFLAAFVPLFVAMDTIGLLPIYISLTESLNKTEQKRVLMETTITVIILGIVFMLLGKKIFTFLGIWVADFKIAGGLVLLILGISDLLFPEKNRQQASEGASIGVVPLAMPLIIGPATLTALIVQVEDVGISMTFAAFVVNIVIVFLVFSSSRVIMKMLGQSGTQAFSKVANLFLAAIAVMIIRSGFMEMFAQVAQN